MMHSLEQKRRNLFQLLEYEPYSHQAEAHFWDIYHDNRNKLVSGGEGSGKSFWTAKEFISRMFRLNEKTKRYEPSGLYWIVARDYETTHQEFEFINNDLITLGICSVDARGNSKDISTPRVGAWRTRVKREGIDLEIKSLSLQDILKISRESPNGILVCEAAQAPYDAVPRIMARVARTKGWIVFSGTFEDALGWYQRKYEQYLVPNVEDGRSFKFATWDNKAMYPGGRNDSEILRQEAMYSPEYFMERFAGVPCPPSGLAFGSFDMLKHTGEYGYEPGKPVYLWQDPGYGTGGFYSVLVVQIHDQDVFIVDEVYVQHQIAETIAYSCMTKPWWKDVKRGTADNWTSTHHGTTSIAEVWHRVAGLQLHCFKLDINQGDERIQSFLNPDPLTGQPHLHINAEKVPGLISEFGGCLNPITQLSAPYKWAVSHDGQIIGKTPEDKNNHALSALRHGLVDEFGFIKGRGGKLETVNYIGYK